MFRNLLSRLFNEDAAPARLEGQDAEVAVAALLVRVARADDHYADSERRHIEAVLRRRGMSAEAAADLRAGAEMIEAEAPDTVRFTRQIKDRILLEDRGNILAALWEIALADDRRDPAEEQVIRLVANLLGVGDRDSALARQRVIDGG